MNGEKFGKLGAFLLLLQVAIAISDQKKASRVEPFKTFHQQAVLLIRLEIMKDIMDNDRIEFFNVIGGDIGTIEMELFAAGIAVIGHGNLFEIEIDTGDLSFF